MASLRSMIIDGRVCSVEAQQDPAKYAAYFGLTQEALRSRDTILVDTNPISRDLDSFVRSDPARMNYGLIPRPKPPYRAMWLEASRDGVRLGELVKRFEPGDAIPERVTALAKKRMATVGATEQPTLVEVVDWAGDRGVVVPAGVFVYWLNAEGDYQDSIYEPLMPLPDSFELEDLRKPEFSRLAKSFELIWATEYPVLHAFARMNCHNVKLVPMASGAPKLRPGAKRPPSSVWHEIKVTALEELRREQKGDAAADGEKREVRFHKVRGHYADYTKGKGLFGRLKVRLWIEEHDAGNPDLGTVAARYKV